MDLGFYNYKELPKTGKYKEGDTFKLNDDIQSKQKPSLAKAEVSLSSIYCYAGEIERVIDGDTILIQISLGYDIITRQRIRLHNVWAAELGTTDGEKALRSLKRRLPMGLPIVIRTRSKDIYGRYVGDVLYLDKKTKNPESILRDGKYLNQELDEDAP
ncbi:thermonuclease family protein [Leptospira inadai]|uniref:Nuclease-like protein n=1 Tax=Leptospira inadai serovar Lyme TaxID=293084 RepID=A0ABX4YCH0_9LEPT|nr:hypothetical protein [Leptospira inadai]PNV71310.1 hypothetical protein BES34_021640 [Leptospira inadai serovar Lyme]